MEISFLNVFITVLFLVLLAVPGFILAKTKLVKDGGEKAISSVVLYVCQPALIFLAFQKTSFSPKIGINMLIVAGLALAVHLVMIAFLFLVFRNKKGEGDEISARNRKINALRFSSVFSNCGFMGIPFLQSLFTGELQGEVLIYGGVVIAVFNVLTWSIGVYMITGDKKQMSFKKAVLNPTVIGLLLGVILFFTVQQPIFDLAGSDSGWGYFMTRFKQSLTFLAEMTTPASSIVLGIKLASVPAKDIFLDKWAYISSLNKLVVMSVISMLIVAFLPVSNVIKYVVFFLLSMPSATSSVMFAVTFGGDGKSASVNVLLSTVLCILSVPLMYLLFSGVFGVPIG